MKTLFKARVNKDLFKYLLNQHKALISVYTILFFALFPLSIITQILRPAFSTIMTAPNPALFPVALVILAIPLFVISPFILFNYVFSKRAVNTFHAMPIRRRDLFSTLTFVSIISVVIPFTFNYLVGYAIAYLGTNVQFNVEHLFNLVRCVVLLVAMSSIAILVITNTGALSEGIIYTGIAIVIPFVGMMAFGFFAQRFIYGYTDISELFLYYLTPIVSLFRIFNDNQYYGVYYQIDLISSYWFIATLIMSVISINIFDNRKSERSEQPFTNNVFFPIVASCFTVFFMMALISIFAPYGETLFQPTSFIMPVMISFIVFLILNIIKNRSTKGLIFAIKNFIIIVILTVVISATIVLSGGFGYVNRVPKTDDISKIVINNSNYAIQIPGSSDKQVIDDPVAIDAFVKFHKSILNKKHSDYEFNKNVNLYWDINFSYQLDNGNTIHRSYSVKEAEYKEYYSLLANIVNVRSSIDILRKSDSIRDFRILSPLLSSGYNFNGDFKVLLDTYYNELDDIKIVDFNSTGGKLIYNILISLENTYYTSSLHIDERFKDTISYIQQNSSVEYLVDAERLDYMLLVEKGESGCFYSPFKGVISTDSNYYSCSDLDFDAKQTDDLNHDVYPYSYSKTTFDVVQVSYTEDYFSITLLLPVVKK